jgi:hypothetical protein
MDSARQRWKVTDPIFVSIDRMAIAFAIAHGVNCIYSNGKNLQMFNSSPTTMERIIAGGSEEIEQKGGFVIDWEIFKETIQNSPMHIMNIFMYTQVERHWFLWTRKEFSEFVSNLNITSIDYIKNTYSVRSFHDSPVNRNTIIIDEDPSNRLVYLVNGEDKWSIEVSRDKEYILKKNDYVKANLSLEELRGQFDIVSNAMEGGGSNKEFLRTLAQYDLLTLCDEEQMKIWYDEFYTKEDGFSFYKPTFYELNAFFQELFKTKIDYMLIFPFLKNSSHPFSKEVVYGLNKILEYMEISVSYDTIIDETNGSVLTTILEMASVKSKEYDESISKLEGSELLEYLFANNLTPMYFYNFFKETEIPDKVVKQVAATKRRRSIYNQPFNKRMAIGVVSGGKKKYRKSPRRKTLRKTRRYR